MLEGNTETTHPGRGTIETAGMSYFTTGCPDKEHGINKPQQLEKFRKHQKGDTTCPSKLPESYLLESLLAEQCMSHQEGPWVRVMGRDNPETNSSP